MAQKSAWGTAALVLWDGTRWLLQRPRTTAAAISSILDKRNKVKE